MKILIKIAGLVEGNFSGKGNNISISQVQLLDDSGKCIKALPINQDIVDILKQTPIDVEIDGESIVKKVSIF